MTTALTVDSITKRFGTFTAVDRVSFDVWPGQVCGFIGPNGAGKTTTMRIAATLDLPDEGDVSVYGASVLLEPRLVRRQLGFMPDAYGAYPSTTVEEYLDFFARAYGLRGKERLQALSYVTDFTGLDRLAGKLIDALSKGMKQRLCLAKTLLHDPGFLILDEPAAGLDPRARVELRELVRALADMGKGVLISSHILSELSSLVDSIAVIESGRIQGAGTIEEILKRLRPHMRVFLRCVEENEKVERFLLERPGISSIHSERNGLAFDFDGDQRALSELGASLVTSGLGPIEFAPESVDLEDVFLSLTEGVVS
jgi:ABC-2 type transport system ATP-binding protein